MPTIFQTRAMALRALALAVASLTCACEEDLPVLCANGDALCPPADPPPIGEDPQGCVCAEIYKPVCGEDGKTYGNACEAACVSAPVAHDGECAPAQDAGASCICPALYKPVCGADGKTYGNACEAACGNIAVSHEGECTDGGGMSASCSSNTECGKGNICYPPTHQCQAECAIACLVYDPVCGADGKTYGCGAEDAHCHGSEVAHPGECGACTQDTDCPHGHCDQGVTCAAIGCPPPPPSKCTVCGDGSALRCRIALQPCPDGQVREIVNGCYGACVDRNTCHAPKGTCSYDGKQYQVGESFPANDGCNSCSCSEGGLVACTLKACLCDYSAPDRKWVAKSAEQCKLVKFACVAGQRSFFNQCGCGCEPEPTTCRVGGCSGQLCVGPGEPDISTCEWREEYACYQSATCALQTSGRCGWTQTDTLRSCLAGSR